MKKVSVIGLGKLGLPLALCFSSHNIEVVGYDIRSSWIKELQRNKAPINEPLVQDLLSKYNRRIQFTDKAELLVKQSDISFIVVPTPSNNDGSFSSVYIEEVIKILAPFIKTKKRKHILVVTSTISPETTEHVLAPLIEKLTEKKVGNSIGLCYSPELIALGSVVQNIIHPDFLFIGESDIQSGQIVEEIRRGICDNNPKVIRTNWTNTEIAKLALNAYITTKISFANMIARISEKVPGADSDIILNAIGQDSRVGTKYLKGGLGFGGPCFPRDNISLYSTIKRIGLNINLPLNTDQFNKQQIEHVYSIIRRYCKAKDSIGILGLSYKPETDVVEESQGILLADKFKNNNMKVTVFDPQANDNARMILTTVLFADSAEDCIEKSRIIIISTQWRQFEGINWNKWKGKTVIDCWRFIDLNKYNQNQNTFIQLGKYLPTP